MNDFENIHLTISEKLFLITHRNKQFELPKKYSMIANYKLVDRVYSNEVDKFNSPIPTNKYVVNEFYNRYRLYRKEQFFKGRLPVIISAIALLKAFQDEILLLLQWLMQLLK